MSTFRPYIQMKNLNSSSRKCGDITYCIQVGQRVYALNCLYCSQICLEWDIFINHIEQEHGDKLHYESRLNVGNRDIEMQENLMEDERCVRKKQQIFNNSIINKFEESESLSYNDPLEDENSMNSTSLEGSMKIDNLEILPNDTNINSNMENLQDSRQYTQTDNECVKMNFSTHEFVTKKEVQEIKEKIEFNKKLIQRLSENVKLLQSSRVKIPTNQLIILPKTPYDDKDEFLKFEKKIKESEENFRKLVDELKETINGHPTKFIRNCWRTIINDEAAKEFCWQGSKDKIGIKHFSTMLAIKSAYNLKFIDNNDTEFEKIVILHFQQAKNRCLKKLNYKT
ncbi:uncharacterized protein ACRADG_006802 [Cochliomyia hominivorax]